MEYKIKLEIFEGPLDLLLYLIKKNDIDITDIPISKVTEQYMQYIEMMKMLDLDVVGDFLVMAAHLMQIKSRMLLPPDPNEEDVEDPREELVQRLTEYQRFKQIADDLQIKEEFRRDLFARRIDEEERRQLQEDAKEVFFEASIFDLINALSEALRKKPEKVVHEVKQEVFTVEQKIHDVLHLLLEQEKVILSELFGKASGKDEIIVTFLAVLELIRLREIKIFQTRAFSDIEIIRNKDNMVPVSEAIEENGEVAPQESTPETVEENGREQENISEPGNG